MKGPQPREQSPGREQQGGEERGILRRAGVEDELDLKSTRAGQNSL